MKIELQGLELQGFHGVLEEERERGQRFLFDVRLDFEDVLSDEIDDAIDYREVVATVREVSDGRAYRLLETLAAAVADALVARFPVRRARVRVRKPDVELGVPVEWSGVTAERP
jgi:dihydroneopterin aldolase